MDLEIVLNADSGTPLYEQIYRDIRERIRSGDLTAGERLPSTRLMSQNLHVARSTVELAYEQLEAEGYIEKRQGSGAYVCDIGHIPELSRAIREEPVPAAGPAAAPPAPSGSGIRIDFSPRTIDMSAFPYATWRRIMRGILTGDRADLFSRGDPKGDLSLRTTIARYLHLARGCSCTPEQIVIGAGNDYLMMLLAMVLGEGRRIGMESPTYLRAAGIAAAMHDTVVPIRSDASGMDIRALAKADCSLAYVMPTRQYPTGSAMPWPRRSQLLQWAAASPDRFIIEDDYDSEFKYRGRPVPSLQSQDAAGRVIYIGTFSKSIAPAVRVSYLILPPSLADLFRERAGILSCTVPRMDQAILDEFIRDGYFERHLNRMRSRYRAKHDLMLEVFQPLTQPGAAMEQFEITGAGAGLHLVLEVLHPEGLPSAITNPSCHAVPGAGSDPVRARNIRIETDLAARAAAAGVHVYPMSEAYLDAPLPEGQQTPPAILLGYAALTENEIRTGAALLAGAWVT